MSPSTPFTPPLFASAAALLLCSFTVPTQAQTQTSPQTSPALTPPSAGQVLRDLQAPVLNPQPAIALPAPPDAALDAPTANAARVRVESITLTGNSEIPTSELQALVTGLVGTEQTLAQLNAAARRITAYYRSKGFAIARAILPAQDITAGNVSIAVIEGRVSASRISNTSRLSDAQVGSYVAGIKPGEVIRSGSIDRSILLLQDTPGIGSSRATLQPGASVGTSELVVEVTPSDLLSANASLDNYGSRYTGEYRLGFNAALASPLGLGDQLSASLLTAGLTGSSGLSFGRIAYQLPIGGDGLRLGAAYFATGYQLGREFAALDASGTAKSASVFAAYPFIRSLSANFSGTASLERKSLSDQINATATTTDKRISVASLGLTGNLQDALWGGGITSAEATVVLGKLAIDSPAALALDAAGANTQGSYRRVGYGLSRLQLINASTQVLVSLSGQQAGKNLDSSEKFSLGGTNGIRAYPQGEASGDEGVKATLELRHSYTANWQITAFYDVGSVKTNKNPFGPAMAATAPPNTKTLAGAGLGLNASFAKVQVKAALAWRTRGGAPVSMPVGATKSPVLLMAATVGF